MRLTNWRQFDSADLSLNHVFGTAHDSAVFAHGLWLDSEPPCHLIGICPAAQLPQRKGMPQPERPAIAGVQPSFLQHQSGSLVLRILAPGLAAAGRRKKE